MGITYADTLPLPYAVGGPNEGIGGFADGLDADPSLETHKDDLNVLDYRVSRIDSLQRFARSKTVRAIAAIAFAFPIAACGEQAGTQGQGTNATAEATVTPSASAEANEACGSIRFETMAAAEQTQCRQLIAAMETDDINQLSGLDQARWASYYRHVILNEKSVLHTVIRAKTLEQPGSAESMALRFITDYQNSVFTLAWHMQNNPNVGNDPRTARALVGTDDPASEAYRTAQTLQKSAANTDLADFLRSAPQSTRLFSSLFPQEPTIRKEGEVYETRFVAQAITPTGSKAQEFSYKLYAYMDALPGPDGTIKEQPDDPSDPLSAISFALGRPYLAATPQIRDASA